MSSSSVERCNRCGGFESVTPTLGGELVCHGCRYHVVLSTILPSPNASPQWTSSNICRRCNGTDRITPDLLTGEMLCRTCHYNDMHSTRSPLSPSPSNSINVVDQEPAASGSGSGEVQIPNFLNEDVKALMERIVVKGINVNLVRADGTRRPLPRNAIEALVDVNVDAVNSKLKCLVCEFDFELYNGTTTDVKKIPCDCTQMYHKSCIIGWLYSCNVCPICGFPLPHEYDPLLSPSYNPSVSPVASAGSGINPLGGENIGGSSGGSESTAAAAASGSGGENTGGSSGGGFGA